MTASSDDPLQDQVSHSDRLHAACSDRLYEIRMLKKRLESPSPILTVLLDGRDVLCPDQMTNSDVPALLEVMRNIAGLCRTYLERIEAQEISYMRESGFEPGELEEPDA